MDELRATAGRTIPARIASFQSGWVFEILVVALLYCVAASLSLRLALEKTNASPVWPASGIALAAVLLGGYRVWPGIFLGAVLANAGTFLMNDAGARLTIAGVSLLIGIGNTLEAVVGRFLLRRLIGDRNPFHRAQDVFTLTAVALVACLVSPSIGAAVLAWAGLAPPALYGTVWFTWWLGDAVGVLLIVPLLVMWSEPPRIRWTAGRQLEIVLLSGSLLVAASLAFWGGSLGTGARYPLAFLPLPWLVWAALRFGPREAASAALITSGIAIWATVHGVGPFVGDTINESLLLVQLFAAMITVTILTMAAVAVEREAAQAKLQDAHDSLETQVVTRTQALVHVNEVLQAEIAERQRAEDALRTAEARFRGLLEFAPDAMVIVNAAGDIVLVNAQAARPFGYAQDELVGQPVEMLVPARVRSTHHAHRGGYFANPRPRPMGGGMALHAVRKDRTEFPVEISLGPLQTAEGLLVSAAIRDITERQQTEEALRTSEAQLRQAQKIEAVGLLAGGIAHDFNNLLTVITGRSHLLLDRMTEPGPVRASLEAISRTAERGAALTRQLLVFSRKQVLQPTVVDLNALVDGLMTLLRRLIPEDIELVYRPGPGLWPVTADVGQLEQVITNLVVNARDAMLQGGRLTIETANVELDDAFVHRHRGAQTGPYVLLTVHDTVIGMDEATQQRMFEPFFTTKERGKGTGLGLATVYGIVKQHEGYIAVESAPRAGATFRVYMLAEREHAVTRLEVPQPRVGRLQGTGTVFLVEDETEVRELTEDILRMSGYTVLSAASPAEALALARRQAGPIDLLLTDVVMPQMSGPRLAESLVVLHLALKVLYMSGYVGDAVAQHGVLDPRIPFIQKPLTPDELARRVREVLDR
jgi:PAS domain S-box-containing protein